MLTETSDYDTLYRDFRWEVPARFNIATAACDRHADGSRRLALIYRDEDGSHTDTTFDELCDFSRRFANVLKADGLQRGDRVGVFLSQSLELPVAHLAAFRSGLVSVPLFTLFGEDALEFRLANSGAKAIVTDQTGWEKLSRIRERLPHLQDIYIVGGDIHAGAKSFWGAIEDASDDFATVDTAADDPAIIIYTSGTTGNPKGALHAHRVLLGHLPNVEMAHDFFPKPGDVMWTPADWAWIGGLFDALFPILPGSMGKATPGFDVRIVDDKGNVLPNGETGIIGVRRPNPCMMLQYWANPEATEKKHAGEFLLTGDLGKRDDNDYFWYMSREDDVITSAGYRIGPAEIEDTLIKHPAVALAAVVGVPDPIRTESVKAWIVLRPGFAASDTLAREIQEFVKVKLAAHEYPRIVQFADTLPMTATGKVLRRELRKLG